jgi:hypothetical protein
MLKSKIKLKGVVMVAIGATFPVAAGANTRRFSAFRT